MSGHKNERDISRDIDEAGARDEPRAQDADDERLLTPPLSLLGGAAGQTPEAAEERAAELGTDASSDEPRRSDES